ncbi:MAG: hypothetical protein ABWZ76_10330 [Acidimicrobiales bacterium]
MRDGEAMGLGTAFSSERYNIKVAVTLSGAAAAVTSEIQVATDAMFLTMLRRGLVAVDDLDPFSLL